jgi:hypothetical protein
MGAEAFEDLGAATTCAAGRMADMQSRFQATAVKVVDEAERRISSAR